LSDGFEHRLFLKIDKIDTNIQDLCQRVTKQEVLFEEHMKEVDARQKKKDQKFTYYIGAIGGVVGVFELAQYMNII